MKPFFLIPFCFLVLSCTKGEIKQNKKFIDLIGEWHSIKNDSEATQVVITKFGKVSIKSAVERNINFHLNQFSSSKNYIIVKGDTIFDNQCLLIKNNDIKFLLTIFKKEGSDTAYIPINKSISNFYVDSLNSVSEMVFIRKK